jgi:hypothetical protein
MAVEQTPGVSVLSDGGETVAPKLPPPPIGATATARVATRARTSKRRTGRVKARQVQRVVTRVDPWSMLRMSLAFALCLWLIIVVASVVIWQVANATGTIGKIENFLAQLLAESSFTIDGMKVFEGAAIAGLVLFVTGAIFAVITSILFNLAAGVFGGIRFTVVELETAQPTDRPRS